MFFATGLDELLIIGNDLPVGQQRLCRLRLKTLQRLRPPAASMGWRSVAIPTLAGLTKMMGCAKS